MVDLFYDEDATLEAVAAGQATQVGDFVDGEYQATVQRSPQRGRTRVRLTRKGTVQGQPLTLTKAVTLNAGVCCASRPW